MTGRDARAAKAVSLRRPRVAILYKDIPQYRGRFFDLLRDRLDEEGVELLLVYGQPGPLRALRREAVDRNWAIKRKNLVLRIGSKEFYWQPALRIVRRADLVIVEQASSLLINHVLVGMQGLGATRLCWWGHGKNFQEHAASTTGEAIKRFEMTRAHWWFAYNEASAKVVRDAGFPGERITLVQNAIDTRQLQAWREELTEAELAAARDRLGLEGDQVCLYSGSMYPEKRLPFLLDACMAIKQRLCGFEMIFIGAGSDQNIVRSAAAIHPWIHYLGPQFGRDRVPYFALSRLLLNPGLVGLGILDSFALEVPIVTTPVPYHSPEVDYLEDGVNGLMTSAAGDLELYTDTVVSLLQDEPRLESLRDGCRQARERYTVEAMVDHFAGGALRALEARPS